MSTGANNITHSLFLTTASRTPFETFQARYCQRCGLVALGPIPTVLRDPPRRLSVTDEVTGAMTPITINLPAGITVSGSLQFRYTIGSTGTGSDDLAIDNVVATSTKTTTTSVTTVTTTADTADNNWTATYTENGPAVSIADTDSSIFDSNSTNIVSAAITLTNPAAGIACSSTVRLLPAAPWQAA